MKKTDDILSKYGITPDELVRLLEQRRPKTKLYIPRSAIKYRFAIVSDTHLVDRACALSELHHFYKKCKSSGITEIIHAGDLLTGISVYRGQINDLLCFGVDAHLKYAAENYPHEQGITTYCISGNHDCNYKVDSGTEILAHLAQQRPDIKYLSMYDATVVLNGVKVGLHHAGGAPAYAESYKLQKYIEKIGGGQKPQIYVLGHYHSALYMFYRNIHTFLPGCWQHPNDFSVRYGFSNMIGGWIIELEVAKDKYSTITDITPKFVAFY